MDLRYDLVTYSDAVRDAYLELLPEQEVEVAGGKLEWKFRDPPGGEGLIAIAEHEGTVVGVNAFMAGRFKLGTSEVRGFQSMDTIVSPVARGQGVFKKLINCFYERTDGELLYGFPNLNSSPAFFGKLGWKHFGPVPMLARPLRTGLLKRYARVLPDIPLPLFGRRCASAEVVARFDEGVTETWNRFSKEIGCAVQRDARFLNWRISDHPSERYTILRSPEGAITVYKVVAKHGARIGYLMEAIGPADALAPLIGETLHRMRRQGADLALAWCLPHSPNHVAHRRAGFYPLPERLRPIRINFGARRLNPGGSAAEVKESWYLSYLDSDTV